MMARYSATPRRNGSRRMRARRSSRRRTGCSARTARVVRRRGDLEHLVDGGQAGADLHRTADAQRFHAFLVRLVAQARHVRVGRDQVLDAARADQRLVDADAPLKARHAALEAADGLVHRGRALGLPGCDERVPSVDVFAAVQLGLALALRAQGAQQALPHDAVHRGVQQVGRHAQLEQPRDRARRVVGVQRREHQVARQGRLHRHLGGLQVADLAHHDDVRVLAHERTQAFREAELDRRLHLHLVEQGLDHLDRILDGADVDVRRRELLEGRVQRSGLARAGRPGHQHDAVRPLCHLLPALVVLVSEAELAKIPDQYLRVENAHYELLAERGRQRGQAQLDLVAVERARLDAPVLRAALLNHVHAPEDLDAAGHRLQNGDRDLVHLVQHAVDAEAHDAGLAPRLDVDVARALLEGVLPEPVDYAHDMRVVRVKLLVAAAQLDQLLEIRQARAADGVAVGAFDRLRQVVELDLVALDVRGIGDHALDAKLQNGRELALPLAHVRLGGRDHRFLAVNADRQDAEARRVGARHHLGDGREVDLQRIDVQVFHADALGEPFAQRVERQRTARGTRGLQLVVGENHQRVLAAAVVAPLLLQQFGGRAVEQPVLDQPVDHFDERQAALGGGSLDRLLHAVPSKLRETIYLNARIRHGFYPSFGAPRARCHTARSMGLEHVRLRELRLHDGGDYGGVQRLLRRRRRPRRALGHL